MVPLIFSVLIRAAKRKRVELFRGRGGRGVQGRYGALFRNPHDQHTALLTNFPAGVRLTGRNLEGGRAFF